MGPMTTVSPSRSTPLGWRWQGLDEPAAARPLLERALYIRESVLDPNHPRIAETLNHLGRVLIRLGDPAAARPMLERAIHIAATMYGPNHRAARAYRETLKQFNQPA
jgi:Tfp pilus assembly protein PilF